MVQRAMSCYAQDPACGDHPTEQFMVSLSSIWNFPTVIHELQACFSTASAASDMRFVRRSKLVIRVQSQYSTPIASFFFVGLLKLFRSTFYCFFLHRRCPL
ncbi:hypothetical protein V6000_001128 [Aspergillus fumigatus]